MNSGLVAIATLPPLSQIHILPHASNDSDQYYWIPGSSFAEALGPVSSLTNADNYCNFTQEATVVFQSDMDIYFQAYKRGRSAHDSDEGLSQQPVSKEIKSINSNPTNLPPSDFGIISYAGFRDPDFFSGS